MKQKIVELIASYSFEEKEGKYIKSKIWKDIYTYNDLKTNDISKNKTVAQVHKLELTDEVLLLIQNGITEKDSLIITELFVSVAQSNWVIANELTKIKWSDILSINFFNHSLVFNLSDGIKIDFDVNTVFSKNKEKSSILVQLLQNILKITKGEKPKILPKKKEYKLNEKAIVGIVAGLLVITGIVGFYYFEKSKENNIINDDIVVSNQDIVPQVMNDTIWSETQEEGFTEIATFKTINVFHEPYQVTMEAHKILGMMHTGGDRIIIPIEIPEKTLYWIYRINLTNARIESGEGEKLIDDVNYSVKKWRIIDAVSPIKKGEMVYDLTASLINSITKPSKEKPFTNIFFMDKEEDARKFDKSLDFNFDINNSIRNTHSRNGLIKFNENKFVYLGLENTGYADNIYVSLEVVSIIEDVKYFKIKE